MNSRFKSLHIAIFILNLVATSVIIAEFTFSKFIGDFGFPLFYVNFFVIVYACFVFFYTRALEEFHKAFSLIGFVLLSLLVALFLTGLYCFDYVMFLFLFSSAFFVLYIYVQFSIFFNIIKKKLSTT